MPRGQPDYGPQAVKEVAASISDMGEVAARLGSIVTYDKRGDVFDFDNFEAPLLKWGIGTSGPGGVGYLDSTAARSGAQSLLLTTPAGVNSWTRFGKGIKPPSTLRCGFEWSFVSYDDSHYYLELYFYDGTLEHLAKIEIYPRTGELYYYDEFDNPQLFATLGNILGSHIDWSTFKVVLDFANAKYARFMINEHEFDLSEYSYQTTGLISAIAIDIEFRIYQDGVGAKQMSIDDFVFTVEEP